MAADGTMLLANKPLLRKGREYEENYSCYVACYGIFQFIGVWFWTC